MDYNSPTPIIKRVGIYLGVAMPQTKPRLREHVVGLEACRFELSKATVDWHKQLAEMKNRMLHPKDPAMTELDRNVMLDAHVSVIRKDYELLIKLEELVHDRIELAKLLLTLL